MEDHDTKLHEKEDWLNKEQFSALHYTSPRTDLTIGLPENHVWEGGGSKNAAGIEFMANMPTEECFTAPDNRRIDGYVTSTKPLSYAGNILENMKFTFKGGKVVEATAEKGQAVSLITFLKLITVFVPLVKFPLFQIHHRFHNQGSRSLTPSLMKTQAITLL